jgi:hypothetical protein
MSSVCCPYPKASRASASIPSRRHRAKTTPKERSVGLTCCTSLRRKQGCIAEQSSYFLTTQHDRTGEDGSLITLDHFRPSLNGKQTVILLQRYGFYGSEWTEEPLASSSYGVMMWCVDRYFPLSRIFLRCVLTANHFLLHLSSMAASVSASRLYAGYRNAMTRI